MENKSLKIGVLGLGLIGGSILKALHYTNKFELHAVSKSSFQAAKEFSTISSSDINILKDCDVVFVCSKMSETIKVLDSLDKILDKNTIVADVSSIKGFLDKKYNFTFIKTHPMAGVESSGFQSSFRELFIDAKWIMEKENEILINLIKIMGAKPVIIDSITHDKLTAQISHLPMLISSALFDCACDDAKKIASSGFRDSTRLAMTNENLAYDMLNLNRENILSAYKKFLSSFEKITNLNEKEFKSYVKNLAEKRLKMYDKNGKNSL